MGEPVSLHEEIERISQKTRRVTVSAVGVLGVCAALTLSGCATVPGASPQPAGQSEPPVVETETTLGETVRGEGPTEFPGVEFPIADGAKSVTIDFTCEGDAFFSVELGDSMMLGQGALSGSCARAQTLAWPIVGLTGSTLHVEVARGVAWQASPVFSTAEFAYDTALTEDCKAFSAIYSALTNADEGYSAYGAFDENEWAKRVNLAVAALMALSAASQSELAPTFAEILDVVGRDDRTVGEALTGAHDGISIVNAACNVNHTPLIISAEFGG